MADSISYEYFPHDDEEEDNFACAIGTHGQIIMTHNNTNAVLSRFTFTYPATFFNGRGQYSLPSAGGGSSRSEHQLEAGGGSSRSEHQLDADGRSKSEHQQDADGSSKSEYQLDADGSSKSEHQLDADGSSKSEHQLDADGSSKSEHQVDADGSSRSGDKLDADGISKSEHQLDADGDHVLVRRRQRAAIDDVVMIEHQQSTSLSLVGEQVWRGALFLADYLLYADNIGEAGGGSKEAGGISGATERGTSYHPDAFTSFADDDDKSPNTAAAGDTDTGSSRTGGDDTTSGACGSATGDRSRIVDPLVRGRRVLELASGVGLTSIVAGFTAHTVLVTDIDRGNILQLVQRNLERNRQLVRANMLVRQLDFSDHVTIDQLQDELRDVTLILAADVVYHNDLTDQFFGAVRRLMAQPPDKLLLVALEKRYVFTLADLDTVAPCYEYFLQCLDALKRESSEGLQWSVSQVPAGDIPQYFAYERTRHLVLWRVAATHRSTIHIIHR